jgi:hypothetical protein
VKFHFASVDEVLVVDYDMADNNLFGEDSPRVSCLLLTTTNDTMIIGNVAMGNQGCNH